MRRREFLQSAAALGGLGVTGLGSQAWAASNPNGAPQRLVIVLLRGAVDGLNVVIPYTEKSYYAMRPTIGVPPPGHESGALDLDAQFALHPQLAPLFPLWKERSLAFVHACGSSDESRSHFEAQAYMESGTPGVKITPDGWLNRTLAQLPAPHRATEAVNFGPTMPFILRGSMPVASLASAGGRGRSEAFAPLVHAGFDAMYSGTDALSETYRLGQSAHAQLMSDLERDVSEAAGGAPSPVGFAQDAARFCQLVKNDPTVQVGFFALSGWDTHVRQGSVQGALSFHLRQLAQGFTEFRRALGDDGYAKTVILVMSEFGRTARENGNGGTDHGHGNVMWVMGGPVRGGKVYGQWPGLAEEHLHDGRDLAVTTDFRTVVASVLAEHLKVSAPAMNKIFPQARFDTLPILQA